MSPGPEDSPKDQKTDLEQRRETLQREACRILRLTSLALFASFTLLLLPQLLTPALLDPDWQLGLINTLLGVAILPLVGICLRLVAAHLDHRDRLYSRGLEGLRRLALLSGAGYLLLLPVQMSAILRLGNRSRQAAREPITNLRRVREQISASRTQGELEAALRNLPGSPRLPAGLSRPLPQIQKQAIDTIDRNLDGLVKQEKRRTQAMRFGEAVAMARMGGLLLIFAGVHGQIGGLRPRKSVHRFQHSLTAILHKVRSVKVKNTTAKKSRRKRRRVS